MRERSSWAATPRRWSATTSRVPTTSSQPRARRASRRRSVPRISSSARASSSTRRTASPALRLALGDKKGVVRYGTAFVPMDEALIAASVDLSGRSFLVFGVPVARTRVSNFDLDLLQEFFRAFAFNAELTLHVTMHYGHNLHHITEAVFKAVGRALAEATRINPRIAGVLPSTKGAL